VEVASNEAEPVLITGTGGIRPPSGSSEVKLGEVTVGVEANIVAEHLVITARLALAPQSSLRAADNDAINLTSGVVDIEFTGDAKTLPALDLGDIGDNYEVVPKSLKVDPPTGLSQEELGSFSHRLISGNTLSNCEKWQTLLVLPASFTSECVDAPGGRLLSGVRSLVVKGVPKSPPDGGSNGTIVIAVVVGGVLVVVAAVAVAIVVCRRRGKKSHGSSPGAEEWNLADEPGI
jgi:hypothetical protein